VIVRLFNDTLSSYVLCADSRHGANLRAPPVDNLWRPRSETQNVRDAATIHASSISTASVFRQRQRFARRHRDVCRRRYGARARE
jgi:hypothetical protein